MSNYRILLRGVKQGQSIDAVALALSRYSKKSPEMLRSLLKSGRYLVAKRTTEAWQATRYKLLLEKLGCDCIIEAELTAPIESTNTTSVLVTDIEDARRRQAAPRGVTYRQTTRWQELVGDTVRVLRLKALTGLIVLLVALYYGWWHLQ